MSGNFFLSPTPFLSSSLKLLHIWTFGPQGDSLRNLWAFGCLCSGQRMTPEQEEGGSSELALPPWLLLESLSRWLSAVCESPHDFQNFLLYYMGPDILKWALTPIFSINL